MSKHTLVAGFAIACLIIPRAVTGVEGPPSVSCPCPPGVATPAAPVKKRCIKDAKGGEFNLWCTNSNPNGDFIWEYITAGGTRKPIGKCVYPRGQNSRRVTTKTLPNGDSNIAFFTHTCVDRNNPKRAVKNIFKKNGCRKIRMSLTYNNSAHRWEEIVSERQVLDENDFNNLAPDDNDGDGFPDSWFASLSIGINPLPPAHPAADFEDGIVLVSVFDGANFKIAWGVGPSFVNPVITVGDFVDLTGVEATNVITVDPRFDVQEVGDAPNLRLMANSNVPLTTGLSLVTLMPQSEAATSYTVTDADNSAAAFYEALFVQHDLNPTVPVEQILGGISNELNFSDLRDYVGAAGVLNLSLASVPAMSAWGIIGCTVGLIACSALVMRLRRLKRLLE